MQTLLALIGAALHEVRQHRGAEGRGVGIEDQDDHKAQQEVHKGACRQDDDPLPGRLIGKGPGVVRALVLPGHGAEAAEGDAAQGIFRLALFPFEDDRAHADGKLLHPHTAGFGGGKVAQLMHGDQHAEQ